MFRRRLWAALLCAMIAVALLLVAFIELLILYGGATAHAPRPKRASRCFSVAPIS
jgi:hypothetical protein